jgi:hypothetical protein
MRITTAVSADLLPGPHRSAHVMLLLHLRYGRSVCDQQQSNTTSSRAQNHGHRRTASAKLYSCVDSRDLGSAKKNFRYPIGYVKRTS